MGKTYERYYAELFRIRGSAVTGGAPDDIPVDECAFIRGYTIDMGPVEIRRQAKRESSPSGRQSQGNRHVGWVFRPSFLGLN